MYEYQRRTVEDLAEESWVGVVEDRVHVVAGFEPAGDIRESGAQVLGAHGPSKNAAGVTRSFEALLETALSQPDRRTNLLKRCSKAWPLPKPRSQESDDGCQLMFAASRNQSERGCGHGNPL